MSRRLLLFLFVLVLLLFPGAAESARETRRNYTCWDLRGESYPDIPDQEVESPLPPDAYPVAGIVSHHLLAGELIDAWFAELARHSRISRFFILSPRHWDLGTGDYSLTDESWQTTSATVYSDVAVVSHLAENLGAEVDPEVFVIEHGVETLMPFIARYFPGAQVVAICYKGEPPVNTLVIEALWKELEGYFRKEDGGENFLLISSDFAHHGDLEGTIFKDNRTRRFMAEPGSANWIFGGCDNRPGIYLLGKIADGMDNPVMSVLYHSNSFYLSDKDADDITSYFFTFLHRGR